MQSNKVEDILQKIGNLLAEDKDYPINETLLHAEAADSMVGPSIFKDRGDHILYREPNLYLLDEAIMDLWYLADPKMRWAEMEYLIRNGKFEVKFIYPEEIAPSDIEDSLDRRDRIVREYFGDKPIVYPPWDNEEGLNFES